MAAAQAPFAVPPSRQPLNLLEGTAPSASSTFSITCDSYESVGENVRVSLKSTPFFFVPYVLCQRLMRDVHAAVVFDKDFIAVTRHSRRSTQRDLFEVDQRGTRMFRCWLHEMMVAGLIGQDDTEANGDIVQRLIFIACLMGNVWLLDAMRTMPHLIPSELFRRTVHAVTRRWIRRLDHVRPPPASSAQVAFPSIHAQKVPNTFRSQVKYGHGRGHRNKDKDKDVSATERQQHLYDDVMTRWTYFAPLSCSSSTASAASAAADKDETCHADFRGEDEYVVYLPRIHASAPACFCTADAVNDDTLAAAVWNGAPFACIYFAMCRSIAFARSL